MDDVSGTADVLVSVGRLGGDRETDDECEGVEGTRR